LSYEDDDPRMRDSKNAQNMSLTDIVIDFYKLDWMIILNVEKNLFKFIYDSIHQLGMSINLYPAIVLFGDPYFLPHCWDFNNFNNDTKSSYTKNI